jgi:hypothetical protein
MPSPIVIAAMNEQTLEKLRDTIYPMIDRALAYSNAELSRDALVQDINEGEAVMLTANQDGKILGLCIGYRVVFQSGKAVLSVPVTSGAKLYLWMDAMVDAWKKLAKCYNCSAVYGTGRPGWKRMMKKYGLRIIHQTYQLDIED